MLIDEKICLSQILFLSLCIMKTILLINLMFAYIVIGASIFMGVCLMSLKYFPTSKVSGFIRRHVITDEDLDPINDESSVEDRHD